MSAKSKSPEAAQQKLWKAELKTLAANRRKVAKDFDQQLKAAIKLVDDAMAKLTRLEARVAKAKPAALRNIDRRIAILNGRLGH